MKSSFKNKLPELKEKYFLLIKIIYWFTPILILNILDISQIDRL